MIDREYHRDENDFEDFQDFEEFYGLDIEEDGDPEELSFGEYPIKDDDLNIDDFEV